ncbi:Multidrug ABC transporter [Candidatus Terasakiella magnetica]|uniref:Multidrug ABC transporter n=1 Tax=Candidatus Terasakiella magnetica TaxID=1867952 RepID=A0A1C3RJT0_9PROT|nr:efflux RND transporter periplasmic adaptor subunit [Candidatus Terasakiella magnetica]SCA57528.1 Multidrug ABC transporter [Candidatus Terasakiella magnetica]
MKTFMMLAATAFLLSACGDDEAVQDKKADIVRPAKIALVIDRTAQHEKVFPGVTEATRRSTLAFRVNGQIIDLPVRAGQLIKQGETIARLDDASYQNTLTDRHAKYQLAKTEFDRQKVLFKQKHVAKSRLDEARSTFEAAQASYKLAKDDLSYTKLVAPYDGMISRIDIDNFQNIQAKEPIVEFQGAKEIDVVFNVPESLFLKLNKNNTNGGHVLVKFDSMPEKTFDAWYREHETVPDATTRSFKVTVSMPRPKGLTVLPGMSVTVSVNLSKVFSSDTPGVLIPLEAVFEADSKTWVWKLDENNTAHKTAVKTTGIEKENIRVIEGLKANDRVIAVGVTYVREGQKVRPIVKERGL